MAEKYKAEQVIEAIKKTKGLVTHTARYLGCEPDTVRNYVKRYPSVAAALKEAREAVTDLAEMALYDAIEGRESWAVCFYLKTQGKSRGYIEKQQIEHSGHIDVSNLSDDELRRIIES